jgi:hypothetical protein
VTVISNHPNRRRRLRIRGGARRWECPGPERPSEMGGRQRQMVSEGQAAGNVQIRGVEVTWLTAEM